MLGKVGSRKPEGMSRTEQSLTENCPPEESVHVAADNVHAAAY